MPSRLTLAIAGVAVGAAAIGTPALVAGSAAASGPTAACPKQVTASATFDGVVTRPENPSANQPKPTASPSASASASSPAAVPSDTATATITPSDTATATVSPSAKPTPASSRTLEIRVAKVRRGPSGMNRHTYTVVDCTGSSATGKIKRNDRVTVTAYRVHGDSHRLYATSIVDRGPSSKPKPKPTASPSASAKA